MPAILTHYTFALEAIPEAERPFEALVRLGAQGPDTFMAYGTVPWHKRVDKKKVQQWGHTMHALPVESVYWKMVTYALKSPDKELLFAYIDGLLMHYAVDRIFHPYIFARSGFDENGQLTGYYSWSHGFFEAVLDKTFAKRKKTYRKMDQCIRCDEEQVKKVSKMWAFASPMRLDEDAFFQSYEDFVGAEKLLYTKTGAKRGLFRMLGKYSTPFAQAHPGRIKRYAAIDVENAGNALWRDPCTLEEHHESIDEMFQISMREYREVHELLMRAKEGKDVFDAFQAWTRHIDHDGSPIGMRKTHFDLCWTALGRKKLLPPDK